MVLSPRWTEQDIKPRQHPRSGAGGGEAGEPSRSSKRAQGINNQWMRPFPPQQLSSEHRFATPNQAPEDPSQISKG